MKLNEIAALLGIEAKLTSNVTQHSWATIQRRKGRSTSIISSGLGHDSERTTQIYLDEIENTVLDEVNVDLLG